MGRKKINKIEKFINDNGLDFSGSGSDLNGNCVILAGYACYLGIEDVTEVIESITGLLDWTATDELKKVFDYAYNNNYGEWWNTSDAKKIYTF